MNINTAINDLIGAPVEILRIGDVPKEGSTPAHLGEVQEIGTLQAVHNIGGVIFFALADETQSVREVQYFNAQYVIRIQANP